MAELHHSDTIGCVGAVSFPATVICINATLLLLQCGIGVSACFIMDIHYCSIDASDDDAHRAVQSVRHGLRYLMTAEIAFHSTTKLVENWSLKCLHVSLICYIITSGKRRMTRKATTMMTNNNIDNTSTDCQTCGALIGECDGFCTALPNELDDCAVCGASIGECDGFCDALPNELDDASEF